MPCSRCEEATKVYCPDCDLSFCHPCSIRAHHPGTNQEKHSLEAVEKETESGVKILSPIIDEILVACVVIFVINHISIHKGYLHTPDLCPITGFVRQGLVYMDTGLFYLLKAPVATYCNVEDSYWRVFTDAWVRNVATDSDSLVILGASFLVAWFFQATILSVLAPICAVIFACFFAIVLKVEHALPRNAVLVLIESFVAKLNFIPLEGEDAPPKTRPRARRYIDYVEGYGYWKARLLRQYGYFYNSTYDTLTKIIKYPMYAVVAFRLACMCLGVGSMISSTMTSTGMLYHEMHATWFASVSKGEVSEQLLHTAFTQLTSLVLAGGGAAAAQSSGALASVMGLLSYFLNWRLLVLIAALYLPYWEVNKILARQQEEFDKLWEGGMRAQTVGSCKGSGGTECRCECMHQNS